MAAAGVPAAATALGGLATGATADPIYAAIEVHREAYRTFDAAVATFALHWLNYGKPVGYRIWAWVVILAIAAFIVFLAAKTITALTSRKFLPQIPLISISREALQPATARIAFGGPFEGRREIPTTWKLPRRT